MPQPTWRTTLGVAKETTPGTGVAPTMWVPWKSLTPKDDYKFEEDTGVRGAPVETYGAVAGVKGSELDFGGDVFADSIGFPLSGLLGDVATTGASAPYTHTFALLTTGDTQPVSQTWTLADPIQVWQYPGLKFSEVGFKWNADGLLEYTAKAVGFPYATGTSVPSYSAVQPNASWIGVVQVGGTAVYVQDGEVNIKRATGAIRVSNGSQSPYSIWAGKCGVEGKLTLVMEDLTQFNHMANNDQPTLDVNFQQGTGAALTQLKLHMSKAAFTVVDHTYGKDYIEAVVTYKAIANTTDVGASGGYSPIKATLQNAMTSGTYK